MATQDNQTAGYSSGSSSDEPIENVEQKKTGAEASPGSVIEEERQDTVDSTDIPVNSNTHAPGRTTATPRWQISYPALLATGLRQVQQTSQRLTEVATGAAARVLSVGRKYGVIRPVGKIRKRRTGKRDALAGWQDWSKFRLWRHTRPLAGSILIIIGAALMLAGTIVFLPLAFLTHSLWPAFLVGGTLLAMGLIPLFLPSYAVITGSIGIVLSLASLLVASFGGFGIGMLFGIIGSALCIAWRPVKTSRLLAARSSKAT